MMLVCSYCNQEMEICIKPYFILKYLDYSDEGCPYEYLKTYERKSYEKDFCSKECAIKHLEKE